MNWILAGSWCLVCILWGLAVYRHYWNRVRDYTDWVKFCDYLHQSMGFNLQPLPQIVADYLPTCRGSCHSVLQSYLQLLNGKVDLTRQRCSALVSEQLLAEFLYQLGRSGLETEQNKVTTMRSIMHEKCEQAKHESQSKASIMLKLLIIIGIAGGILWI